MYARKRNAPYLGGIVIVVGLLGLAFGSWPTFWICFLILIVLTWIGDAVRSAR